MTDGQAATPFSGKIEPKRGQFSLLNLLIATGVVALLCAIFFTLPGWMAVFSLLVISCLTFSGILAALVYGQKSIRAFALGTLPALAFVIWVMLNSRPFLRRAYPNDADEIKLAFALIACLVVASGGVSCGVRWLCVRLYGER